VEQTSATKIKSNQTRPKNKIVDPKRHHPNVTTKEMVAVAPQQCSLFESMAQMPERGERIKSSVMTSIEYGPFNKHSCHKPPFHTPKSKVRARADHDSDFDSQLFGTFARTDVYFPLPWTLPPTHSPS
jgi:hypothetical protein